MPDPSEHSASIAIASDHAGFEQKQLLAKWLAEEGWSVVDLGPQSDARVDYPDYAAKVAGAVATGRSGIGVLICGTGIGMAISANKFPKIRSANATTVEFAVLAREHNDANVLTLSARFVTLEQNRQIVEAFLSTAFGGGRHAERVAKISALEEKILDDNVTFMPITV